MFKRWKQKIATMQQTLVGQTVLHLSLILLSTLVFVVLCYCGVFSHQSTRFPPPGALEGVRTMDSAELEQALQNKKGTVTGLILLDQMKHIIVLRPGFEEDRMVVDAEVGVMTGLAKQANIPITSLPTRVVRGSLNFYFWVVLLGLVIWLGIFLFRRRDEYIPSRAVSFWEGLSARIDAHIKRRKYRRGNFFLMWWFIALGILVLISASGIFHSPVRTLPSEYARLKKSPLWQIQLMVDNPAVTFKRAVVIEGMNSVCIVMVVKGKTAEDVRDSDSRYSSTTGENVEATVMRLATFADTRKGKADMENWIAELKERNVPLRSVAAVVTDTWVETMPEWLIWLHWILGGIMVALAVTIGVKWEEWTNNEVPQVKHNGAAVGGGIATSSGHQPSKDKDRKTLADVAGCDEAVAKFRTVVEWLQNAKVYEHFGAKLPNGVLLYGPPGTGKTLLARAVAGEVGGSFFHISASEFIEMYVGVGASRVRSFFAKGKSAFRRTGKPSILFIDEIDAVGKKRSEHGTSGDGERDQTVNQLLTEIQGFDVGHGCLVIAATNRPETLDEGLTRPGRFDYKIEIAKPDRRGRKAIFGVHGRKCQIEDGLDRDELFDELARRSSDFSGAAIELAVNEAITRAAKRSAPAFQGMTDDEIAKMPKIVTRQDFHNGIDQVLYGEKIESRVRTAKERRSTAVHEIGHAALPTVLKGDPVSRITIVMTTKALGLMESHSEEDRYGWTKEQFYTRIKTMLGGRVAEEVIESEISTGASNDLERASHLARCMVGIYGMSELGPISIPLDEHGFPRAHIGARLERQFDMAWRKIIAECEEATRDVIRTHKESIERVATVLLDEETITGDRFRELWNQ